MKLADEQVLQIEYAAALHDIGKIGVADGILFKPEPLEVDEWQEMRRHSELGYKILNRVDFLKDAAEIVYSHHERFDGSGYPRGLAGKEIALGARVFSVVDAYDAMTSRPPYRDATRQEDALANEEKNSGLHRAGVHSIGQQRLLISRCEVERDNLGLLRIEWSPDSCQNRPAAR